MAQPWDGRAANRPGAAPSSVSMAVLCVVIAALVPAWTAWSGGGSSPGVGALSLVMVLGLPALLGGSALLTAVYVLPTVALGHWFGRLAGQGRRWWWVAATTALGLLPAAALTVMVRVLRSGSPAWQQLALEVLLFAGAVGAVSMPASVAVHLTMLREDAGRPVRPVGGILLWGALALSGEVTACMAFM
ncbi:hypothetical protein [Streptomyces sp. OR43]|uniref:hypothetical protein n=1 Tax=Streptomyces sp. or43 TaxID=2478957 RepID=UPI0011CDE010|nr:hypothetical protein [Streptomyces sp. or43]TXS42411.1 hypothetical protein EAO72_12920 [Streptomyces sp. or43]